MQPIMTLRKKGEVRWEWIGDAWKLFSDNPGSWIGMIAIALLIYVFAIILPSLFILIPAGILASGDMSEARTFTLVGSAFVTVIVISIIALLVGSYLTAGFYRAAVRQGRGEAISVGDLFSANDSFLRVLGLSLLFSLINYLVVGVEYIVSLGSVEISALISLVRGLFTLFAMGCLFYTIPLIVDRKIGIFEAIKTSVSATLPQWWMYVIFVLVLGIIAIAGLIPCGLGLFVTFPLVFLTSAAAYRDTFLVEEPQSYERFTVPPPPSYQTTPAPPNYQARPPQPQFSNPPQPQFFSPPEPPPPHAQETQLIAKTCPSCGATLTRVANFCNQCGSPLSSS